MAGNEMPSFPEHLVRAQALRGKGRAAGHIQYVVLDRDGTLIRHVPYLSRPEQVEVLPGVVAGLTELRKAGCKLFLHTNQSGIGRGYFSLEEALACNEEMLSQIGLGAQLFESVCVAPEAPDQPADYRKPSLKFGAELIEKYKVKPHDLCYVGDNVSDLLAAKNIGCHGIGVNTGLHDLRLLLREQQLEDRFPVFESFLDAVSHLLAHDQVSA
jgi:D-glycero-D-manno-heptose 1,7-bisphosphate phosphatase